MLAETSTTEISKVRKPKNFNQNKKVAKEGGSVAGNARVDIESRTGRKVITSKTAKALNLLVKK